MLFKPEYDENGKKVLCEMNGINSEMLMDIYVKKLKKGETLEIIEDNNECAILLLSGDVTFKDDDSDMGFVFQKYALYDWKTVEKNVELPLKFRGVSKKERSRTAKKYIDLVGLDGFAHSYPVQLSGGMKQRVGIARAYAMGHSMILMDEPFGALDAQTRYQMEDELLRMRNTEKATVVFVTNNIEEAIYLGDRILLFSDKPSRVVEEFVPKLKRPRNNASDDFMAFRTMITGQMDLAL